MSDILIRGMEMPKAGQSITIAENVDGSLFARLEPIGKFHPIVELPEHGDLVDADELKAVAYERGKSISA